MRVLWVRRVAASMASVAVVAPGVLACVLASLHPRLILDYAVIAEFEEAGLIALPAVLAERDAAFVASVRCLD